MPSRKKAQGKARKAAQEEEKRKKEVFKAAEHMIRNSPEVQLHYSMIDRYLDNAPAANLPASVAKEVTGVDPTIAAAAAKKCWHGFDPTSFPRDHICRKFMIAWHDSFFTEIDREGSVKNPYQEAFNTTRQSFPDVYGNHWMMELVFSYLVFRSAQKIIEGEKDISVDVAFASFFEQLIAVFHQKSHAVIDWRKVMELLEGVDEHTVVLYLKNRIPCSCLDEKYKEVKSIKRMCLCYNTDCTLPDRKMERKKRLICTRCTRACYCSAECQKANWPEHKHKCDADVALREAREAAKKGETPKKNVGLEVLMNSLKSSSLASKSSTPTTEFEVWREGVVGGTSSTTDNNSNNQDSNNDKPLRIFH